jgi:hypothetical protein
MNTYANIETGLQFNTPASQTGQAANVLFTIYDLDATGGPTIVEGPTNTGVEEAGDGIYILLKVFNEGRFSIFWELTGTPYKGSEEINVQENIYDHVDSTVNSLTILYSGNGVASGDRLEQYTGYSVLLQFALYRNSALYNPYSVVKVEIFNDYAKAVAGNPGDVLETITSITNLSTGIYTYTAAALSNANVYFDKITVIEEVGNTPKSFIAPFYIRSIFSNAPVGDRETAAITLNIYDILNTAQKNEMVQVELMEEYSTYSRALIDREVQTFRADAAGLVTMNLIETTTMSSEMGKTIYYKLSTLKNRYIRSFTVPKGTITANFFDLPTYTGA